MLLSVTQSHIKSLDIHKQPENKNGSTQYQSHYQHLHGYKDQDAFNIRE